MNAPGASVPVRPWYREIWPWALMLPPLLSVIGGVTMIVLATRTPSALVVEDYARIEELTAARFALDRAAAELGLEATLSFAAEPARVEVALAAAADVERPRALLLHLRHATNPAEDHDVRLVRFGEIYTAEVEFSPGRYGVELVSGDGSWRLSSGVVRLPGRIGMRAQAAGD